MPTRKYPLITGQTYHVFNKSIHLKKIFVNKRDCSRALEALWFYRTKEIPIRFAEYKRLPSHRLIEIHNNLTDAQKKVSVLAFALMPNHFHLVLRQEADHGISEYLANWQNSYTRYYNTIHKTKGPFFLPQFKAVRIETDSQLLHVCRYVHINPITGYLLRNISDLLEYPWTSHQEYLGLKKHSIITNFEEIMAFFNSKDSYLRFIEDQLAYQRELKAIEHLTFEE